MLIHLVKLLKSFFFLIDFAGQYGAIIFDPSCVNLCLNSVIYRQSSTLILVQSLCELYVLWLVKHCV